MKILLYGINYSPELTGIGKYTGEMSEWLAGRGYKVRVVTAPPYYPQWRVAEGFQAWRYRRNILSGVEVWRCPLWVPTKLTGAKRLLHLASFSVSSFLVVLAQTFWRPNVILVIEPPLICAPSAMMVARLSGATAWLHIQDYEVDAAFELGLLPQGRFRDFISSIERWLMNRFDRVSTISSNMMRRLADKGVAAERCVLFPNWVDTQQILSLESVSTLRGELGIADDEAVVLYSGNMGKNRGWRYSSRRPGY